MLYKWIGACFIIIGCGGFGFSVAAAHRRDEHTLRQFVSALDYMECDLQYHMTPLPDLCRKTAGESHGYLRDIFLELADALDMQISPDVGSSMREIMAKCHNPLSQTTKHLLLFGSSLGRFDLKGQLQGLESVRSSCRSELEEMSRNRESRLRCYQTLGLCGGAALIILFI